MNAPEGHLPPAFYNDLNASLDEAWRLLEQGVRDRKSGFHTLCVGTNALDGAPTLRTVVLRGVDRPTRTVRFHTDARSSKIAEIDRDPRVALHFYDARQKIQLRLLGKAAVHGGGRTQDEAWAATRSFSRECYRVVKAPGTPIGRPEDVVFSAPGPDDEAGLEVFRPVTVAIGSLEWLYLASQGHRRARFRWDAKSDLSEKTWLVP